MFILIRRFVYIRETHQIKCPYCDTENTINVDVNSSTQLTYIHPPDSYSVSSGTIYNLINRYPKKVVETNVTCTNCSHRFHVELIPFDANHPKLNASTNYYLRLLKYGGNSPQVRVIENRPILLRLTDYYFDLFYKAGRYEQIKDHNNYLLDLFIACIPFIIFFEFFILIPLSFLKQSTSNQSFYLGILLIILFSTIILVLLRGHCNNWKWYIDRDLLPIDLHKNYKQTNSYVLFREIALKGSTFGRAHRRAYGICPATFFGLFFTIIALLIEAPVLQNLLNTSGIFSELNGCRLIFGVFCIVLLICFTFFIMGNIFWISIDTLSTIGLLASRTPLKIDPHKEMAGVGVFGKSILSSIYLISFIWAFIPMTTFIGLLGNGVTLSSIIDQLINIANLQLPTLYSILAYFGLYAIFLIFCFAYPIMSVHEQLRVKKDDELAKILDASNIQNYSNLSNSDIANNNYYLKLYDRMSSMAVWPFNFNLIAQIAISLISAIAIVVKFIK